MKILIAAIGKAKSSPEQQLYLDYIKRLPWKVACKEFEVKLDSPEQRKSREGDLLIDAIKGYDRIIAMDEKGKDLSSREFSKTISGWQQQGYSSIAIVIGGADGLDDRLRKQAHLVWSLGRVTWPHMLIRPLLAEQLYRAHSLMTGHPYHRD